MHSHVASNLTAAPRMYWRINEAFFTHENIYWEE